MIAIFGSLEDPHAQEIEQKIRLLGYPCAIISTARKDLKNTSFVFLLNDEKSSIEITQGNITLNTNSIHSAWVCQPIFSLFSTTEEKFSQELKFWFFTWRESLNGIYALLEQRGILVNGSISEAVANQNKIRYIGNISKNILKQPKSIISNDRESLLNLFRNSDSCVVLKTLHQMQLSVDGEPTMLLASIVQEDDFLDFQQKNECPIFLQEYVEKIYDVRLTIIGDHIFSCKIDATHSDAGRIDWRAYDLANTPHSQYDLPSAIAEEIIGICRKMKLDYATIDLCVDQGGNYYLLDINPFGRYLWIEDAIGAPITDAIAKFLIKKQNSTNTIHRPFCLAGLQ